METLLALLAICATNSPVTGEFPAQMASNFFFFDLRLNKQLSKQSWGWWFETPSRPLWRHCNAISISPSLGDWNKPQTANSENCFWLLDRNYTTVHLLWNRLFRVQFFENYHIPVPLMPLFKSMGSLQSHPKKHFMENSIENNKFSLTNCTWLSSVILSSFCQGCRVECGGGGWGAQYYTRAWAEIL